MTKKAKNEFFTDQEDQQFDLTANDEVAKTESEGQANAITDTLTGNQEFQLSPENVISDENREIKITGLLASYSERIENPVESDEADAIIEQIEKIDITDDYPETGNGEESKTQTIAVEEITRLSEDNQLISSEKEPATPPRRVSFFQTNFRELDRDLSPEQQQEWNNIYASYRSKSVLTGIVAGVDENSFEIKNPETGLMELRLIRSLVVIDYRIKVLIPEPEVWALGNERPDFVMRGMVGAKIDYVVMQVDREGEFAIASRRSALAKKRRHFMGARSGHEAGELLKCNVLVVGPRRVLVECAGYDVTLSQRELSWTAVADLRREYRPGQELSCKLIAHRSQEEKLIISVRDTTPNPFVGAENRHPIGSRRQAVISGKYAGGVFCRLNDDVTVLCLYSNMLGDDDFFSGDSVLIHITQYDYQRQLIFGRIITKW